MADSGGTLRRHGEPGISVVIPVFNRERSIGRAIESVLGQTHPPQEILVIDDGSTDGTAGVVGTYGEHVRYVRQSNAGASIARNKGVGLARAPWVAFLDSDDHWVTDHLARMAETIAATRGEAAFYFGDCLGPPSDADGTPLWPDNGGHTLWESSGFRIPGSHLLVPDATEWVLMDVQPTMLQASVFNRQRYLATGGLWPRLRTRHDTHLYFVMGIGGPACAVAGAAAQMTADDVSGHRLTDEFGPATADFWVQTRLMYLDVLNRFPRLPSVHRRRLNARLAAADVRLGEDAWRAHRARAAARHLVEGARAAPGHVAAGAMRRVGRIALGRVASGHG